jgi:(p)ppGpp synthase/HD superfamily hydrolase
MGLYSPRIDSALCFAARLHANQRRKGTDIPYIVHPMHVALLLDRYGFGEDVLIAGLLHDVVEDTPCGLAELREEFGDKVADLVDWCTGLDKSFSWEVRKQATVERLRAAPVEAKAVACADKAHNLNTIVDALERGEADFWSRFSRGPESQLVYFRGLVEALGTDFVHPILRELQRALQRLEACLACPGPRPAPRHLASPSAD